MFIYCRIFACEMPNSYLQECLVLEVYTNKKGYVISLQLLPCQVINESDSFNINLKKPVVDISSLNPDFAQMTIDFHTKLKNWSIDKPRTSEGAQLDSLIDN